MASFDVVLTYALFALGIPMLWKGADLLVEGGVSIAKRLGVSSMVIGLTLVSAGTSAPELGVNLFAAWRGSTGLAVGNVLGSNAANTLLILGVGAIIAPLAVRQSTVRRELPFSLLAAAAVGLLANEVTPGGLGLGEVSLTDGLILLALMAAFLAYVGYTARTTNVPFVPEEVAAQRSVPVAIVEVVVAIAALALASDWIVDGALLAAADLGVREGFIGFTLVAFGTSLPELATTVSAARRGETDVLVGNVIGSNVFNLLLVVGATALLSPVPFDPESNVDLAVVILSGALVAWYLRGGRPLTRGKGISLVLLYAAYLVFLVVRG